MKQASLVTMDGHHNNGNTVGVAESRNDLIKDEEPADCEEEDTKCGYNSACEPACLQKCANPKVFLLLITIFTVIQS